MIVQIPASVIVVSLFRRAIAINKSIMITADKTPRVTSQTVVDSMAVLCQDLSI
jgi:hypothetical protein